MDRAAFDDYIQRFNAKDLTTFDDYFLPDVRMLNGTLELLGVPAVQEHYTPHLVTVHRGAAASTASSWTTTRSPSRCGPTSPPSTTTRRPLFGPVRKGETFDFRGLIMYWVQDGRFANIEVAYNTFTFTDAAGQSTELGIPH